MTLYGTPGGTPLNTTPFQGTQPGNPVQATVQIPPQVGLFVPNSNNAGGKTILACVSDGTIPINALATNIGTPDSSPGRTLAAGYADGGRNGAGASPGPAGLDTLNSDANGGNSLGAGGANQTEGPTSGQSNQLVGQASVIGITIPAATQYGG